MRLVRSLVLAVSAALVVGEEAVIELDGSQSIDLGNGQTLTPIPAPPSEPVTSTHADIGGNEDDSNVAARQNIKDYDSLVREAEKDAENPAVIGCFDVDEEGGVKNRDEEGSAYMMFRQASVKNPKIPFFKLTDEVLCARIGAKELPAIFTVSQNEKMGMLMRRAQFFDDLQLYENDDPNKVTGMLSRGNWQAWGPEQALEMMKASM